MKNKTLFLSAILVITILTILGLLNITDKINFGLDLQGGFEILYELEPIDGETLNKDAVEATYKSIQKRIDVLGVSEPEISIEGDNRIRIRLAGVTNKEEAREILSKPVYLTFRGYNNKLLMSSDVLKTNGAKVTVDKNNMPAISLGIEDIDTFYNITNEVKDLAEGQNFIAIWIDFDSETNTNLTSAIECSNAYNDNCLFAAYTDEAFASDVMVTGDFELEETRTLVELINSGSMPTKLTEISSRTVEASFGIDALNKTTMAGLIGIGLIFLFMILIYKFQGIITSISILLYGLLVFTIFYLIGGVLTLPGIAALVLGIGMAVDANIITLERIKEELRKKHSFKEAIKIGNKNSLSSIIDANITTLLIAIVLFIFGESAIKGFATMLIINIVVTILVMVILYRFILKIIANTELLKDSLYLFIGYNKKSKNFKLDFIKNKTKFFIASAILIISGIIFIITSGLNLGIDFTGGSFITLSSNELLEKEEITNYINETYNVIDTNSLDNGNGLYIKIEEVIEAEKIENLASDLNEKYQVSSDIGVISNKVKVDLVNNAIKALIFASIGIILYITLRFKFSYAISAMIALFHDVLAIIAVFALLKLEVSSLFIAAILAIIGYSINDTIVSFDRIRENEKEKLTLKEIINLSLNQTVKRSLFTSITTLLPVILLAFLGSYEIINFNIALLIGLLLGTYSSIFIASQIWLIIEERNKEKPKKEKKKESEPEETIIKGIND